MRTEADIAAQTVIRLVDASLFAGKPETIARAARAVGIPVAALKAAHEHLQHHAYDPPTEARCAPTPPPPGPSRTWRSTGSAGAVPAATCCSELDETASARRTASAGSR